MPRKVWCGSDKIEVCICGQPLPNPYIVETFVRQTLLWLTPRPPTHPTGPLDPQNCPDPSRPARNRLPRQTLLRHIVLQ